VRASVYASVNACEQDRASLTREAIGATRKQTRISRKPRETKVDYEDGKAEMNAGKRGEDVYLCVCVCVHVCGYAREKEASETGRTSKLCHRIRSRTRTGGGRNPSRRERVKKKYISFFFSLYSERGRGGRGSWLCRCNSPFLFV